MYDIIDLGQCNDHDSKLLRNVLHLTHHCDPVDVIFFFLLSSVQVGFFFKDISQSLVKHYCGIISILTSNRVEDNATVVCFAGLGILRIRIGQLQPPFL